MLVVDRVVLQLLEQVDEVVRLRDERAVVADHPSDAAQLREEVVHVREHVRPGHDGDRTVLCDHSLRDVLVEELLDRRHALVDGDLGDVGRLDPEHAQSLLLESLQQRAVVRAEVDGEVGTGEFEPLDDVPREATEVLLEEPRHRRAVRVLAEEHDVWLRRVVDLGEPAGGAPAKDQRKVRLRLGEQLLGQERVARSVVAEVEHAFESRRAATLAVRDRAEHDLLHVVGGGLHAQEPSLRPDAPRRGAAVQRGRRRTSEPRRPPRARRRGPCTERSSDRRPRRERAGARHGHRRASTRTA